MANPKKPKGDDPRVIRLQNQVNELTEALKRERADAINVRRRAEEDKISMASYYKAKVIQDLLPVIDNLERAIANLPKAGTEVDWIHGINKIYDQLKQSLSGLGVESIGAVGEPFDPKIHEAVLMEDSEGAQEVVSEVLQTGYKLGDEVIRHAMVKVAKR